MSERRLHLNVSLLTPGHFRGAWRLPERDPHAFYDIAHFQRNARLAEQGRLHAVFVGDAPAIVEGFGPDGGMAFDPTIMFGAIAAVTERIGMIATASATYNDPYNLARRFLSLDHVSGGRAGWNVVTSISAGAALNFGLDRADPPELRYERAEEFVDVVRALWDSWEPDAVIADRESGMLVDVTRVRPIEHRGRFFKVHGPLTLPRSPQGRPLIVQAGSSEAGRELAARVGEVIFTVQHDRDEAKDFRRDLRARAERFGRPAESLLLSPGVIVVLGDTTSEAQARVRALEDTIPYATALVALEVTLGVAPGTLELDRPVRPDQLPSADDVPGVSRGFAGATRGLLARERLTARDLIKRSAGGSGHRLLAGTPAQIADTLVEWFDAGAADGFTIMPGEIVGGLEAIVRTLIPELQRRGVFHTEYPATTLRENLGLPPAAVAASGDSRREALVAR
jgi:FMN-dependent oxidoreductase (nitrilotriacetate monooxygenase family)